jgi:hypothetical protein
MSTEERIKARANAIEEAARVLIGVARRAEIDEGRRTTKAELVLDVDLTAGGTEQWTITIERTASSH